MLSADLDRAAADARALEAANVQLTTQLADARATVAAQAVHIGDLEHQLADCRQGTPPPTALQLGVYKPWFPGDLATFVSLTGKPHTLGMQYADYRAGYDAIANPWILSAPPGGGTSWAAWLKADSARRLLFSVPMLTAADKGNYGSVAADAAHKALAQRLVALGIDGQVIVRLGWECNGTWFPWSTDRDGYKAMFRRLVGIYRAVSSKLRFVWNVAGGAYDYERKQDIAAWYPGDDVVDVPSIDQYDELWQQPGGDPAARWAALVPNLQRFADLCTARGKRGALDEWGLVSLTAPNLGGGGDNPTFTANMLKWCKDRGFLWECFFEDVDGGLYLRLADAPKSLAAYKAGTA